MLNKLRSARHMVLALRHYRKNEIDISRRHVDKCLQISHNADAVVLAFDATILVLEQKSFEAKKRFEEARISAATLSSNDADYVAEYCKYYECMISKDPSCDRHRVAALEMDTSQRVRTWLSLPLAPI